MGWVEAVLWIIAGAMIFAGIEEWFKRHKPRAAPEPVPDCFRTHLDPGDEEKLGCDECPYRSVCFSWAGWKATQTPYRPRYL